MARVGLYERFLTGPSLQDLRVDAIGDLSDRDVIDIGCGNALVWAAAKARDALPKSLTLVDISAGMLEEARARLSPFPVRTLEHDLNRPLGLGRDFDLLTAFHMLYHLADPFAAVAAQGAFHTAGRTCLLRFEGRR